MEGLIIVLFVIIAMIMHFSRIESHEDNIKNKIDSLGGCLINYERRNFFTGIGPFILVGKRKMVYRIEYEVEGIKKEGWVRFGGLSGPDWRM
ncbi:hypothetical protein [Tepidibacter hydrothermalis]|uniref:DUF3301 domain-containing protein n=1 Tax=Tepidibacter hydrothermalis TaxID=3036126 RepID=A0ABY8ECX6_9FIRM|nr:hypothetical protein [Tepidibacter hydrothermalis]WFD08715.1 hypothetical protein P4S50_09920 [Tepidibacter hydrothermalis]